MAAHGAERCQIGPVDTQGRISRSPFHNEAAQQGGNRALADVAQSSEQRRLQPEGTQNVGAARIAAAVGANVVMIQVLAYQKSTLPRR